MWLYTSLKDGRSLSILAARFIAMLYKLPSRNQRRLDANFNLRLVVTTNMVLLGACDDDDDEALYTPQPMSVSDIARIIKQCRPSTKDLPTDPQTSLCVHPDDAQVESYGQLVCTLCGLCTGCVYERPCYLLPDSGLSIQHKHY